MPFGNEINICTLSNENMFTYSIDGKYSLFNRNLSMLWHLLQETELNPLSVNPTIWSNTLEEFVGFCRRIV